MSKQVCTSHWRVLFTFGILLLSSVFAIDIAPISAQATTVPKGVNGYTVSIGQNWVAGYTGFRPVRVTVETNPAKAVVEDEWFEIQSRCQQYGDSERVTSAKLVIPAGQKSGSAEIYVHDMFTLNARQNQILVTRNGGRVLMRESGATQNVWANHPKILMISDEFPARATSQTVCHSGATFSVPVTGTVFTPKSPLPSFSYLSAVYHSNQPNGIAAANSKKPVASVLASWRALETGVGFSYTKFADLPQSWIGLEGIDQIIISLDELRSLTRSSQIQRSNIEKWIITGGVLIVSDTGPEFKKAKHIWPSLLGADREFAAEKKHTKWRIPDSKVKKLRGLVDPSGGAETNDYRANNANWMSPKALESAGVDVFKWKRFDDPLEFPESTPFGICDYLDGCVVAVDADMSKWRPSDWKFLHNSIAVDTIPLNRRVAVAALGTVPNSSNFQIPGVGQPPVQSFQILIGLFLLLAGPIMVIVLKRLKQMQYLFIAVPLLSAAVCASLFLYAILVDGSNRWGRCHTVTHLDHQTSMAITHSRATYYCGKHPGKYEIPADGLGVNYAAGSTLSRVEFEQGLMKLSGGDITARVPHEITVARPYQTMHRLLILPGKSTEESDANPDPPTPAAGGTAESKTALPPRIQNRLGADVRWALIRTDQGFFVVKNLEAGQTVGSKPTTWESEMTTARSIARENSPEFVGSHYQNNRYASYSVAYDSQVVDEFYGEDHRVVSLLRSGTLKGLLDRPNSYIALMEEFPLAAEQLEPVDYKMQLHVVRGQW